MKTLHTFSIVEEDDSYQTDLIYPETTMKIHSEASLQDMLYAFERFLEATGYVLPKNCVLDFIDNQTGHAHDLSEEE
jgi:hypothetical protein